MEQALGRDGEKTKLSWPTFSPLPRLEAKELREASATFKARAGLGTDRLHPRNLLDLNDEHFAWLGRAFASME